MPKSSLLDAVGDAVKACKPVSWWDALPKATQDELLEIRKAFQSGAYPVKRLTLARILVEKCHERGIKACGLRGFSEWLSKD